MVWWCHRRIDTGAMRLFLEEGQVPPSAGRPEHGQRAGKPGRYGRNAVVTAERGIGARSGAVQGAAANIYVRVGKTVA